MTAFTEAWLTYVWAMLWQSTLVMLAVWFLYAFHWKRSAALRYALLCLILIKFLLPTSLHSVTGLGHWLGSIERGPALQMVSLPPPETTTDFDHDEGFSIGSSGAPDLSPNEAQPIQTSQAKMRLPIRLFSVWLAGVLFLATLLFVHALRIRKRFSTAIPISDSATLALLEDCRVKMGVSKKIPLYQLERLSSPVLAGLFRPRILISRETLERLGETHLRPIFLHELAHAKRRDLWVNTLQIVLQVLWFFHPGLWLTNWLIRRERERACDDRVLALLEGAGRDYADSILRVLKESASPRFATVGLLGIAERGASVKDRIRRILDSRRNVRVKIGALGAVSLLVLGAVLLPMAKGQPTKPEGAGDEQSVFKPLRGEVALTSNVSGIVRDETDQPVSGAPVQALQGREPGGVRQTLNTDQEGRFVFEDLRPEGIWFFSVDDPRYAKEWDHERYLNLPVDPQDASIEIRLSPPHLLEGQVLNGMGAILEGVEVIVYNEWLEGEEQPKQGHADRDIHTARTDSEGKFSFARLRRGKVGLILEHPQYAMTWADEIEVGTTEANLVLDDGLSLRGKILKDGAPIPSIGLKISTFSVSHRNLGSWLAQTDENGSFEVPRIPRKTVEASEPTHDMAPVTVEIDDENWASARYRVYAQDDGAFPEVSIEAIPKGQTAQEIVDVSHPDEHLGRLRVRTAEPAEKNSYGYYATINLTSLGTKPPNNVHRNERLGENGSIEFQRLPAGKYRVSFWGGAILKHYLPQDIEIRDGESNEVTLQLGPSTLRGTIRPFDSNGSKDLGWFLKDPKPDYAVAQGGASISSTGEYRIEGLTPGKYSLVYAGDNIMKNHFETQVMAGENRFDIELPKTRIEGHLVGTKYAKNSNFISGGAAIQVFHYGERHDSGAYVHADEQGRFEVNYLIPLKYQILYGSEDYGLLRTAAEVRTSSEVVSAELRAPEKSGEIIGTLVGLDQAKSADFKRFNVEAHPKSENGYDMPYHYFGWGVEEVKGNKFEIKQLLPGTYGVLIYGVPKGALPYVWRPDVEVREGLATSLEIELPDSREVSIEFETGDEEPREVSWYLLLPEGGRLRQEGWIPSSRHFRLPYGEYSAEWEDADGTLVTTPFVVTSGTEPLEVRLTLPH